MTEAAYFVAGFATAALLAAGLLAWDPTAQFIWSRLGRELKAERERERGQGRNDR